MNGDEAYDRAGWKAEIRLVKPSKSELTMMFTEILKASPNNKASIIELIFKFYLNLKVIIKRNLIHT